MFQWNHERLSALQAYGGARWKNPDMQTDFMAQEAAKNVPGWKGLTDINDAGSISYAYEGFGNKGEMNRGSSRMRSVSAALALWKARKASSGGGGDYKTFGNWHKEGKTFGHTITCENDKGALLTGSGRRGGRIFRTPPCATVISVTQQAANPLEMSRKTPQRATVG